MQIRLQLGLVLCLLFAGAFSQVTDALLPKCALACFDPSPPQNDSSISCRYKQEEGFEETFSPCFYDSCTMKEALTALNITSIICGVPDRDISVGIRIYVVAAMLISSAIIGCRVVLKFRALAGEIGWDDWTIVIAVLVTTDAAIGQYIAAQYGLGRDAWKVPFEDQDKVFKAFYASTAGYKLSNMFIRMSILCFYLRIFNTTAFRRVVYAAMIANAAIGAAFVFTDSFQCKPVDYFWNQWDGIHQGTCLSIIHITWAHSILNIILDVATLAMAVWMVKGLHMRVDKKFSVIGMFVLGSAITLVTFLRLQAVPPLRNTRNRTWSVAPLAYWSGIEIASGLICACLPALKKLRYLFRDPKPSTYNFSSGSGYPSNSGHSNAASSRSRKPSARNNADSDPEFILESYQLDSKPNLVAHTSTTDLVEQPRPAS